jgi:hypothetical protein
MFLPKNYEVPESGGSYLKLGQGATKFRIVSDAVLGFEYWNANNKPVRLKESPKNIPPDISDDSKIKHFWAFAVIDRSDGNIKILEITQATIRGAIKSLVDSEDWGDPKKYDITVNRTGEGLDTKYTVQPSPHNSLSKEEESLVKETSVKLEALFYGANPFDREWEPVKIVEPEEEVKIEDVPF